MLIACLLPFADHAQVLQGAWVEASEAEIDQHRKTDVTVIVLDQNDQAIEGATVHLVQQRHDFVLGLTLPAKRMPPNDLNTLPIYRCLNAIALDRQTNWSASKPVLLRDKRPDVIASWHRAVEPIRTSYGRVISADPARNTDKLAIAKPADLRDAVMQRIDQATSGLTIRPDSYDIYADLLQQDMIERKLGMGMIHRMFTQAQAIEPDASLAFRMRDAISLQRGRDLIAAVQRMEIQQVPFDRITIEQRFNKQINPNALKRMLNEYVGALPMPVTLAGIEAGGNSAIAAGLNMEMLLRLAFAQPNIDGIYLHGLYQDELIEEHAALLERDGKTTPAGQALDRLFYEHWMSDETRKTDERGNAQARIFTGWYAVATLLPNGKVIKTQAYIPKSDRTKLIVMQQTAAEAGSAD